MSSNPESQGTVESIAVIGLTGRFPGANNVEEFWTNLKAGAESISRFSDDELKAAGVDPAIAKIPGFVNAGSILTDVDMFDAPFFGFSPRDAETTDPQQRLFLECAWETLENAGYCADTYPGSIAVFGGSDQSTYLYQIYANPERLATLDVGMIGIGNDKDYLTTLVSYKLNLRGPSVAVQTACSTSLVAVALGCQSLWTRQCDMALAGGVAINVPQKKGYFYQPGGILSPDGHCRTFDASGQGTVVGNGVAMVLMKRLTDALTDGDQIRAVIRGAALNNDGSLKVGFGAPSVEGQAQAIAMAQAMAGVHPDWFSYIEAHGTATILGDPIEFAALNKVFSGKTTRKQYCAIGSLKSNVGHLSSAAGAAGLIKTVLALENEVIPPSLHFERPNPQINFADSPFYVCSQPQEWKAGDRPRVAGVSSFGVGGTNAHVVVQEAPQVHSDPSTRPAQLVVLSARSETALEAATDRLATHLDAHPSVNLADVAYTLQVGRKGFSHRRALISRDVERALAALRNRDAEQIRAAVTESSERPLVFMFSGQGAQYVGMGRQLYELEQVFRDEIDRCHDLLKPHVSFSLRDLLYPSNGDATAASERLRDTAVTQPALFAIEYALSRLLISWGIYPLGMIGHSIGEYAAACLAGVLSLEDAVAAVALRGQFMSEMPRGSMLAVPLSEADVQPYLNAAVSLAAANAPSLCVLSGLSDAIETISGHLAARGLQGRLLHTSHAFHSHMMDPAVSRLVEAMSSVTLNAPQVPYISTVSGTWITAQEATSPDYWGRQLRHTVRFSEALGELLRVPQLVLLEVGPGNTLASLARMQAGNDRDKVILSTVRQAQQCTPDYEFLLDTVGQLWLNGVEPQWQGLYSGERRLRCPLPTYPFEKHRYWIGLPEQSAVEIGEPVKRDVSNWFYVPSWKPAVATTAAAAPAVEPFRWLVFVNSDDELSDRVVERVLLNGADVDTVTVGDRFDRTESGVYQVRPGDRADYASLVRSLRAEGQLPNRILHLWNTTSDASGVTVESFERAQARGFHSVTALAEAFETNRVTSTMQLGMVTTGLQVVLGDEALTPEKAPLLGAIKVVPQELTNLRCRNIDIVMPDCERGNGRTVERIAEQLVRELSHESFEPVVAYRNDRRWVQTFEPMPLKATGGPPPALLKEQGVYLITGGLGSIGLTIADYLARTVRARLVLLGRSPLPDRAQWESWVTSHAGDETSRKIRSVIALESAGAEVLVVSADTSDPAQMRRAVDEARSRFGRIDGVVHGAGNTSADGVFPLGQSDPDAARRQFAPKAHGIIVLHELLRDDPPDFFLMLSSLSCVLGGLGLIAYSAANVFLDAYAAQQNARGGSPWITVNWDAWQFLTPGTVSASGQTEAILPDAGVTALDRILAHAPRQVVASVTDLQSRLKKWVYLESLREPAVAQKASSTTLHPRPNLGSQYVPPTKEIEKVIAGIWQQVLGIAPIGVHDKFFELGGHSLLAIQLISQLRDAFQVEIAAQRLFEAPTIAQLAETIEASLAAQPPKESEEERLARMLELVEGLSEQEVAELLNNPEALARISHG